MPKIAIKCNCSDTLPITSLTDFQKELKIRDENDIEKIVKSIKKFGFTFPFFVWKDGEINYVLDGHGRLQALLKLQSEGYEIQELPVVFVNCKDESSAKDLLLRICSVYGKMTKGSILNFINGDFSVLNDDFVLPTTERLSFIDEFKQQISVNNVFSFNTQNQQLSNIQENATEDNFIYSFEEGTNQTSESFNTSPKSIVEENVVDNTVDENIGSTEYKYYQQPDETPKVVPTEYVLKLNDIKYVATELEYNLFKNYVEQYAAFHETTVGAINELFKHCNQNNV